MCGHSSTEIHKNVRIVFLFIFFFSSKNFNISSKVPFFNIFELYFFELC